MICVSLLHSHVLWCDNVSALALASNPVFHAHTKHIEVNYHFFCKLVIEKDLVASYVESNNQLADSLTKPLPASLFLYHRTKLMVIYAS